MSQLKQLGQGRRIAIFFYWWFGLALTISVTPTLQALPAWSTGAIAALLFLGASAFLIGPKTHREFIEQLNIRWLTLFHVWRVFPGMVFLVLAYLGVLPSRFAVFAGVGDLLVALTAPFFAERVELSNPKLLIAWHSFGALVIACAFANGLPLLLASVPGMELLTAFPLSLLSLFFVPFTLGMHALAFYVLYRFSREP